MNRRPSHTTIALLVMVFAGCSSSTETAANQGDASAQETGGSSGAGGAAGNGGAIAGGSGGTAGTVASDGAAGSGGSSSDSGVASDGDAMSSDGGDVRCWGPNQTFPMFEKSCTADANCVLVSHTTSCCGSALFMGINHDELTRFQSAESICDAQYPGCGCASQGANAEDGTLVPWGTESMIVVSCNNGLCQSHYGGKTFPCGTATCTDQEYCTMFSGGPAGSGTSYNCTFLGGCPSCSCVGNTGCQCSDNQGFITVSCAAP